MKTSLLATVAAVALIAGAGLASAQKLEAPPSKVEAPNPAPNAQKQAPAEKVAPARPVAPDKGAQMKPDKPATIGQAQPQAQKPAEAPKADTAQKPDAQPKKSDTVQQPSTLPKKSDTAQQPAAPPAPTTGQATRPAAATVTLNADQKTKIRSTVLTAKAPRVSYVNFQLNVGTMVPRSVHVVAVPSILVDIHPAWRGYMYFVVGDQIIVVEPRTMQIVAVLDV